MEKSSRRAMERYNATNEPASSNGIIIVSCWQMVSCTCTSPVEIYFVCCTRTLHLIVGIVVWRLIMWLPGLIQLRRTCPTESLDIRAYDGMTACANSVWINDQLCSIYIGQVSCVLLRTMQVARAILSILCVKQMYLHSALLMLLLYILSVIGSVVCWLPFT